MNTICHHITDFGTIYKCSDWLADLLTYCSEQYETSRASILSYRTCGVECIASQHSQQCWHKTIQRAVKDQFLKSSFCHHRVTFTNSVIHYWTISVLCFIISQMTTVLYNRLQRRYNLSNAACRPDVVVLEHNHWRQIIAMCWHATNE